MTGLATASRLEIIRGLVSAPLGLPALPVELDISDADVNPAIIEYYSNVPIKITRSYNVFNTNPVNGYEWFVNHKTLFPDYDAAHPDAATNYFYIGVLQQSVRYQLTNNNLDSQLLGVQVINPIAFDPLLQISAATMIGQTVGDLYCEEDWANGRTHFVSGGMLVAGVVFGVGHVNIEYIPYRHIKLMSYLISQQYYQRLIAIRKTGSFKAADFTISVEQLEQAYKDTQEKARELIDSYKFIPVDIG